MKYTELTKFERWRIKMIVFQDNTIRDGMQQRDVKKNMDTKRKVLSLVSESNVDSIEVGMCTNWMDYDFLFQQVQLLQEHQKPVILTRMLKEDIDISCGLKEIKNNTVIKLLIPISDLHIFKKLNTTKVLLKNKLVRILDYLETKDIAVDLCFEDATRADENYLFEVLDVCNNYQVGFVTLPDTVGCTIPTSYGELFNKVSSRNYKFHLAAHCHNDLGLATANTIAAVLNGARQVETTFLGIGERAGNTSIEEVLAVIQLKLLDSTHLNANNIYRISKEIERAIGYETSSLKPIIGANAFVHESGIHQDGMLKDKNMYQFLSPIDFGLSDNDLDLTISSISSSRIIKSYIVSKYGALTDLEGFINFYKTVSKVSDDITLDEAYELHNLLNKKGEINHANIVRTQRQLEVSY